MNLGLIGFGEVGKSFVKLLKIREELLDGIKLNYIIKSNGGIYNPEGLDIKSIINHIDKNIKLEEHPNWKNINIDNIIENKDIDCLIELTSTNIKDGEPGYTHIKKALTNKIHVVTGNKGPIIHYYKELKSIADNNNISLKVGCTTGGALPSVDVGNSCFKGSKIIEIQGVLNGTSNYIIEEMTNSKITYIEALEKAQSLKIAEANPYLDVSGYDTAAKMLIISKVVMDLDIKDIYVEGIENIGIYEIENAEKDNKKIKLIGKISSDNKNFIIEVKPQLIDKYHPLYSIDGKNKGVYYKTDILGDLTIIGGASSPLNAASSILRDLISIC